MARTFRRQRQTAPISELNVTNLIDLGFTLLIIFMIATPLINQEQAIQINLPNESKRSQAEPDKDLRFQSISINSAGQYFWGDRPVAFGELPALLEREAQNAKPPVIRIRADWNLQYQKVVTLMDEIKKHNLSKITFDTQTTD
jgi:biopolymer transport protein TolR